MDTRQCEFLSKTDLEIKDRYLELLKKRIGDQIQHLISAHFAPFVDDEVPIPDVEIPAFLLQNNRHDILLPQINVEYYREIAIPVLDKVCTIERADTYIKLFREGHVTDNILKMWLMMISLAKLDYDNYPYIKILEYVLKEISYKNLIIDTNDLAFCTEDYEFVKRSELSCLFN
jgi:hypothetical protein